MNTNDMLVDTEAAPVGARRTPMFGQDEKEVNFSDDLPIACCGKELNPFWAEDGRLISLCEGCGQKFIDRTQVRYGGAPWIGVDLDGTLAHDVGNNGLGQIGRPIKPMLERLKKWITDGKTVKIFTARASSPKQVVMIRKWLFSQGLPDLEVTNVKDLKMIELWDDRCVQVMTNSGKPINDFAVHNRRRSIGTSHAGGRTSTSGLLSRLRIFLTL